MIDLTASDRDRACTLLARLYQPRNKIYGKGVRVPRTFPADDLAWLEAVGLAPNQRKKLTHAAAVKAIVGARDAISIAEGARAFVATLGTGAPHGAFLELALMAHRMPSHRRSGGGGSCRVCMMDKEETVDRTEQFLDWHRSGSGIPGDPKANQVGPRQ